jgi:predicted dithiol-disulfide oxidoreductase (DUF899 family)
MANPPIVTRGEWLSARLALLAEERAATRARDELNAHALWLAGRR